MILLKKVKAGICEIEMPKELAEYWAKKDPNKYSIKQEEKEIKKEYITEEEKPVEKRQYNKRSV